MSERPKHDLVKFSSTPDLITEVRSPNAPELTRREQQDSAKHLILALETLVDEEVARETDEFKNLEELKSKADLVILALTNLSEGEAEKGEPARPIALETLNQPLVDALVYLFNRLPEFRHICTNAPQVSLEDTNNELFNPFYVAFARALQKANTGTAGEDPKITRLRGQRIKLFTGSVEDRIKEQNSHRGRELNINSVTPKEIQDGASALLELVREEKDYLQDVVLRADAERVEEFLELMTNPAHMLTRYAGEYSHQEKTKLVELIGRTPPQLGLAELPTELYNSAKRLRAFNRRFNTACLGYNILHGDLADFKANPLNLARAVSKERVETHSASSLNDGTRLKAWDRLEPDTSTLQGADISYESAGVALAKIDHNIGLSKPVKKRGMLGKLWGKAMSKLFAKRREQWEREQKEQEREDRRELVESHVSRWMKDMNNFAISGDVYKLCRELAGGDIQMVYPPGHEKIPDMARPELAEAISEAITKCADTLDPDFSDYWKFLHAKLVSARDADDVVETQKWNQAIYSQTKEAGERLKTLADNRFYYPEHVASFRKKTGYEKSANLKVDFPIKEVVEIITTADGATVTLHKDGTILTDAGDAPEVYSAKIFNLRELNRNGDNEANSIQVVAARFLPPDGKQVWVYTSDNKLKLFKHKPEKKNSGRSSYLTKDTSSNKGEWKEEKIINIHPDPNDEKVTNFGKPIFIFNGAEQKVIARGQMYNLTENNPSPKPTFNTISSAPNGVSLRLIDVIGREDHLEFSFNSDEASINIRHDVLGGHRKVAGETKTDYNSNTVLHNNQFISVNKQTKSLEKGQTIPEQQTVFQVLSKDAYLATVISDDGTYKLQILRPGEKDGTVIVTGKVTPGTEPLEITFARVQPDGHVIVGKRNGVIDIYDGVPVEEEPVEKRLDSVDNAIKVLKDRTPGTERVRATKEVGTKVVAVQSHPEHTTTTTYIYPNEDHQKLVESLEKAKDVCTSILTNNPNDAGTHTAIDFAKYKQARKDLDLLEDKLKKILVYIYVADDVRTPSKTRLRIYDRLPGGPEEHSTDERLVIPEEDGYSQHLEYFNILNAFVRNAQYILAEITKASDEFSKKGVKVENFAHLNTDEIVGEIERMAAGLKSERDELEKLLTNTLFINRTSLRAEAPLSEYVDKKGLKPVLKTELTANILGPQELRQKYADPLQRTRNLRRSITTQFRLLKDSVETLQKAEAGQLFDVSWGTRASKRKYIKELLPKLSNYVAYLGQFILGNDIILPEETFEVTHKIKE